MISRRALESVATRKCIKFLTESRSVNLKGMKIRTCQICNDHSRCLNSKQNFDSLVYQNEEENHQTDNFTQLNLCRRNINESRFNEINIQMLSKSIHEQVFTTDQNNSDFDSGDFSKVRDHLNEHDLWGKDCTVVNDVNFQMPKFHGKNISEHFENIAKDQISKYLELAKELACSQPPPMPKSWHFQRGWTKYTQDGAAMQIDCPDCDVVVFDVEVCMNESELPIMATAASPNAWYFCLSFGGIF